MYYRILFNPKTAMWNIELSTFIFIVLGFWKRIKAPANDLKLSRESKPSKLFLQSTEVVSLESDRLVSADAAAKFIDDVANSKLEDMSFLTLKDAQNFLTASGISVLYRDYAGLYSSIGSCDNGERQPEGA